MARAALRKAETAALQAQIGQCLNRARHWLGWSLKEAAAAIGRDERQVARWERGEERTPVDLVFAVPELQQPFVVQLAQLSGAEARMTVSFARAVGQ